MLDNLSYIEFLGFSKGFKNVKIAVVEHLELKMFFAAQRCWAAFKWAVIDLKILSLGECIFSDNMLRNWAFKHPYMGCFVRFGTIYTI